MTHNEVTHTYYKTTKATAVYVSVDSEVQYRVTMIHVFRRAVGRSG
jgi:hypothetical protein